ncbi:MAG: DUF433 domain-containing protein [bacterium]|nr:DUF433 domain-containing protein [bacterium]
MTLAATTYEHIVIDQAGVPVIAGANTKILQLVIDMMAHGSSPEELRFQYPHLSLGQIHSALAYYWDHKEKIDADIERRFERVERWRRETGPSSLVARLRERGAL